MTPTQRTLKALREQGYRVGTVERFIGPLNIRVDLFHIIDLIAIKPGEILGVQSCGTSFSQHYAKLTVEHLGMSIGWMQAGGKLQLWGWRKLKVKRGGKAMRYYPRVHQFDLADLQSMLPASGQGEDPSGPSRGSSQDPDQARDQLGEQGPRVGPDDRDLP